MTQATIAIIDEKLGKEPATSVSRLPEPIKPRRLISMGETLRFINEGQR